MQLQNNFIFFSFSHAFPLVARCAVSETYNKHQRVAQSAYRLVFWLNGRRVGVQDFCQRESHFGWRLFKQCVLLSNPLQVYDQILNFLMKFTLMFLRRHLRREKVRFCCSPQRADPLWRQQASHAKDTNVLSQEVTWPMQRSRTH